MLLTPELNLLDCLNIKGIFGYESNNYNDKTFQKTVLYDAFEPAGQASNQFVARNKQTDKWEQYNNMTASVTATFDKTFGKHALTVLAGASAETHKYKYTTNRAILSTPSSSTLPQPSGTKWLSPPTKAVGRIINSTMAIMPPTTAARLSSRF